MPSGLDQYQVLRMVREGLYGSTAHAADRETGQRVALQRIVVASSARVAQVLPRLVVQIETLGKLALRGVRRPLHAGAHSGGGLFVIWEWIEGQPLRLPANNIRDALLLMQQVAATLESAHRTGFVHLLLRPSQILVLTAPGELSTCSLLGLGLTSALGLPGQTLDPSVLAYLAPEVRRAQPLDSAAADVFALGRILGALLGVPAGGPPGDLGNAQVTLSAAQKRSLGALREQMLRPSPEERPTMGDVVDRLRELQSKPTSPDPDLRASPPPREQPAGDPLIGQDFGNFRILRRLGQGGMGTVYEAKHKLIETRAALKVLKKSFASPDFARRFLDEARAVNIVAHPNLVSIFEFGQRDQDGLLYIVMEYLQGTTFESLLEQRKGPLSEVETLPLALQLARALASAHRSKVIHRDLKPSNVMLVPEPMSPSVQRVKILDFGIAKVKHRETPTAEDDAEVRTEVGAVMGTPLYMAPEQYRDASEVTGKADVFALGVLLFEILTAKLPFGEASTMAVLERPASRARSLQRSISPALSDLIAAMLEAQPDVRPAMADVATALERMVARQARSVPLRAAAAVLSAVGVAGVAGALILRPPNLSEIESRYTGFRLRASTVLLSGVQPERPIAERLAAVAALGAVRDPAYRGWLIPLVKDGERSVVCAASGALGTIGDPSDGAIIAPLLDHPDEQSVRICAAIALLKLGTSPESKQGQELARELLRDPRQIKSDGASEVRAELADGLLGLGEPDRDSDLTRVLTYPTLRGAKRLYYLERLAEHIAGEAAITQLRRLTTDPTLPPNEVLGALASLIRLGQATPGEHRQFLDAAERGGQSQLFAAVLRVNVDGEPSCDLFWKVLVQDREAEERRQIAARGLAHCSYDYAAKMDHLLTTLAQRPLLRIAVAESLLHIVGPDWQRSAFAQQSFIRDYRSGASLAERLAYLDSTEALPAEQAEPALTLVLREDSEGRLRRAAAQRLRRGRVRAVLTTLAEELLDARSETYEQRLHAVSSLLTLVDVEPPVSLREPLRARLHDRLRGPLEPAEELVLRSLLLRCGEAEQAAVLLSKLPTLDRNNALLAIELSEADSALVTSALAAPDPAVRLAGAQRRVEQGKADNATRRTLNELLQESGPAKEVSLLAYFLLYRIGEHPRRPAHLPDLLGRGDPLPVRWRVTNLVPSLPLVEALPLLAQASTDPAAVIRHEVVRAAWTLYQKTPDPRLIELIISLASDPELPVRLKAAQVLEELTHRLGNRAGAAPLLPAVPIPVPKRQAVAQGPSNPPAKGTPGDTLLSRLGVAFPQGVRARLLGSGAPRELIANKELVLPAGRYRISTSCGEESAVELRPGEHKSVRVCEAAQLLDQVRTLRQSGNLAEAHKSLDRLLAQLKGRENSTLYERARFERGELLAAGGNLDAALGEFNAIWRRHLGQPNSAIPSIEKKLDLLRSRVGRLSIYNEVGGKCTLRDDSLFVAGHTIRSRLLTDGVLIRAGEQAVEPPSCRGSARP